MPADKIISINLDSTNPRQANVNAMPAFTFGNTDRVRIELYSGGELAAFDTTKDYIFALGINGRASAGGYVLTYGGDSTQELPATAAPSAVESALNALASVTALGGLKVVGSNGGPYKIVWNEPGEREAISAKNTLYPNAAVYSRIITSGDDGTAAQQALAFKLSLLSGMSNVQYLDVKRTIETTEYVEVQKPVSVTTKTTVTDPETGETTTTETTETRTETVTEPQVNTTTETIKGAMEFDLSLATVEAFLAIGGASNLSAMAEFAEVSASGEMKTRLLCECSIFNGVIPDAETLIIASQELANITATAKFYAIGTQETPPSIIAGTIPSESDKGSAYYYAQLAANSQAATEGAEEAAQQAQAAAQQAQAAETNAAASATQAQASATAAQASQAAAAQSETNAQASTIEAVEAASISTQKAADAQNAANAAAQSAANAQQISDPENRIGALQLLKSGEGQLYFNGGTATNSTFAPLVPFSAVATVVFTGGASKILTIGNAILSVGADGKLTLTDGTHSATSTTTITQGVPVALTMIVKGTTALVYAGTTQVLSVTSFAWSGSGITVGESGNTIIASRIAVFNFDLSASGVLYSVSDYENGKEIPPMMFSQQQYFDSSSNWAAWHSSNYSIDKSNGIKVTITNAYSNSYALIRITGLPAFMAGTIAQVSYESLEQTVSSDYAMTPDFYFVGTQGQSDKTPLTDSGTTYIAKAKYDSTEIRLTLQFPNRVEFTEGTYIQLNGIKIIINGVLFKLGDYTIKRNATTRLIKDESGHGLDATVSAGVCGTKDAAIATFVDEIKTQINQSNG